MNRPKAGIIRLSAGFTLIEVMVAVAVLSFGMVLVYQAFFVSLDAFNYSNDHLEIFSWMENRIWQAQDSVTRSGALESGAENGEFSAGNRKYSWSVSQRPVGSSADLFEVSLSVNWKEGKRQLQASRTCYARYEKE